MSRITLAVLLLAIVVGGCSSGGSSNAVPPAPPYKDWRDQLIEDPKRPDIPPPKVGDGAEFTAEQRQFMGRAFRDFRYEQPEWPALRAQWLGLGPRAVNTLVENLFYYMLAAQNLGRPDAASRAQAELVDLGITSVPFLVATLEIESFTDRQGNRQPVDEVTRQTAARTLGLIGTSAVAAMARILPTAPDGSRRVIAKALADAPGPEATGALIRLLDDENVVVATEAAWSLRTQPGRDVTDRLVGLLGDMRKDVMVRQKAGNALLDRRDPAAVRGVLELMERAAAGSDLGLLRACGLILRRTTGLGLPNDPKAWREALDRGR